MPAVYRREREGGERESLQPDNGFPQLGCRDQFTHTGFSVVSGQIAHPSTGAVSQHQKHLEMSDKQQSVIRAVLEAVREEMC